MVSEPPTKIYISRRDKYDSIAMKIKWHIEDDSYFIIYSQIISDESFKAEVELINGIFEWTIKNKRKLPFRLIVRRL